MNDDNVTELNLTHMVRPALEANGGEGGLVPGLLLLHGRGADEEDLMGLVEAVLRFPCDTPSTYTVPDWLGKSLSITRVKVPVPATAAGTAIIPGAFIALLAR